MPPHGCGRRRPPPPKDGARPEGASAFASMPAQAARVVALADKVSVGVGGASGALVAAATARLAGLVANAGAAEQLRTSVLGSSAVDAVDPFAAFELPATTGVPLHRGSGLPMPIGRRHRSARAPRNKPSVAGSKRQSSNRSTCTPPRGSAWRSSTGSSTRPVPPWWRPRSSSSSAAKRPPSWPPRVKGGVRAVVAHRGGRRRGASGARGLSRRLRASTGDVSGVGHEPLLVAVGQEVVLDADVVPVVVAQRLPAYCPEDVEHSVMEVDGREAPVAFVEGQGPARSGSGVEGQPQGSRRRLLRPV